MALHFVMEGLRNVEKAWHILALSVNEIMRRLTFKPLLIASGKTLTGQTVYSAFH